MKKTTKDPWKMIANARARAAADRRRARDDEDAEGLRQMAVQDLVQHQSLGMNLPTSLELRCERLAPGAVIPSGCLAMRLRGAAIPFDAAGFRAGAKLLGFPVETYDNGTGAEEAEGDYRFHRCRPTLVTRLAEGDEPTEDDVGGEVAVASFNTLKRTIEPGDLRVLYAGPDAGGGFLVMLP